MPPQREEKSQGSQIVTILLILLVVFGVGAAYFKLTGSVM